MNSPVSKAIAQQAIRWFVELQAGADTEQLNQWRYWREADPEHERAWQRIERVNQQLGSLSPAAARAALNTSSGNRRQFLKALSVIGIATPLSWLGYRQAQPWLADCHTGVGERREWLLADDSQLMLNTDTAVNLDTATRSLHLLRGEIQLKTSRRERPFMVTTEQGALRVEQAHFNLRLFNDYSLVSVLSGEVQIRCAQRAEQQALLGPGQQTRFTRDHIEASQPFNSTLAAWRDGMLVADNMRLADFLAELGRYHRGWLEVDPQVAELKLSGTYPLANSQAIINSLARTLPVTISRRTDYWISIKPRHAG